MPGELRQGQRLAEVLQRPLADGGRSARRGDGDRAGALPLAALTAYQALVDTADVRSGQRVLIHAAAGGVGHLAVQIAKSRGAYVIGTASTAKHDFLRSLGADEVIDYHAVDFAEALSDVDVVLDPISFDSAARARSLAVLRPGGTLVSILPVPVEATELAAIAERGIRADRAGRDLRQRQHDVLTATVGVTGRVRRSPGRENIDPIRPR